MADIAMPPPPPPPAGGASPGADDGGNGSSPSSSTGHSASTARPARGDGAPPRKQSKRASAAAAVKAEQATGSASDAPTPAGPPYICPTCSTSYSRLEYLRRHERRHADIRPFVCECTKSFSRSDVLSRHKRQCPVALGQAEPGDIEVSAPPKPASKPRKSGGSSRKRASGAQNNGNDHAEGRLGSPSGSRDSIPQRSATAAMARTSRESHSGDEGEVAPREPPAHSHMQAHMDGSSGAAHGSSAGYPYGGVGPAALMPPVLFAPADSVGGSSGSAGGPVGFGDARGPAHAYTSGIDVSAPLHAQVSALNAYASQHAYPASPESSASLNSTTSSPRFAARDMSRVGSGSRFSLRKGTSSLDQLARAAGGNSNGSAPAYGAEFWEALDLSAKAEAARNAAAGHSAASSASSSRSRASTNGASVGMPGFAPNAPGQNPAFSYPAPGEYGSGSSADGLRGGAAGYPMSDDGQPPPPAPAPGGSTRGEPQRFSSVTGPLSPFSSIALTSSMSPYLSAFSNARDTPLVSSPSRGPGTPGGTGSANVFDWTMRPPSKPASQSGATAAGSQRRGSGSAHAAGTTTPSGKRKRGDDDEARTAPSSQEEPSSMDVDAAQLLETLRSLRNNGVAHAVPASEPASSSSSARVSSAELQRAAASLTTAAASSAPGTALTVSAAVDGPTEAFARETSPGPEVFLLRLQGGQQESAAGVRGGAPGSESTSSGAGLAAGAPLSSVPASNGGLSVSQAVVAPSPGSQALWDSLGFGNPAATPMSAGGSSLGWLMSPSIQQLINTFAVGTPGEGGSYFSGATLGSDSTSGSMAPASTAPQQALPASEGPAASQAQQQQQQHQQHAHGQQTIAPSSITLERAFSDVKNPFYIPPDLFRACYAIPHWTLPPLTRLSMLALHSQQNLLKHFPILHEPTFRLDTTPGCLAFATCMLGCHEAGRRWWAGEEVVPYTGAGPTAIMNVPSSPDRLTRAAAAAPGKTLVDEEDGQELVKPVVMQEKTDMLMRNFAGKAKTEKDRISVVQALMLFQGNNFLSSDARTRAEAARAHSKVVSLARDAGFFDVKASHAQRDIDYSPEDVLRTTIGEAQGLAFSYSFLPTYLPGCSDEEKVWRRWSELASRRRTAFLIMVMDTVASLDAGTPLRIGLDELGHMPLPSPDTIWRAPYAEKWRAELDAYRGPTFDESLFDILAGDGEAGVSPGKTHPSIFGPHGPFARLVVVVALLRGILHLLEGRSAKVPTPSPLERWMEGAEQRSVASGGRDGLDAQVDVFKRALARWRSAWDSDELCLVASGPLGRKKAGHAPPGSLRPISEGIVFTSQTASGATPLCDDALPFYWLAHVLLGHASSSSVPLPRRAPGEAEQEGSHDAGEPSQQPGAPDFRSMLRFAKAFVNQGEGSPNTSSGLAAASAFIPITP